MTTVSRSIPFVFESKSFGALLRQRRESAGLPQAEVGLLIGRSNSFIGEIERDANRPFMSLSDFVNLCNLLDLNPCAFFQLIED